MLLKKEKKQPVLHFAALLLAAVFAIFLGACNPEGVDGVNVSALNTKINEATAAKKDVLTSTNGNDVPTASKWVTPTVMTAFDAAITEATQAKQAKTQLEVDAAVEVLSVAITTFNAAKQDGKQTSGYTADQVAALIAQANTKKADVTVSATGNDKTPTEKWVTQEEMTALETAITALQDASGQAAVDAAYDALSAAITAFTPKAGTKPPIVTIDYSDTYSWGTEFTPLTLGLTPGNDTTEVMLNWYSSGGTSSKVAHVRFIEGTLTAGADLKEVTGEIATVGTSYTAHKAKVTGLKPGSSYQYSVSTNGTDWSPMYNFKIPANTGAWTFAVVADPQLNAAVDNKSRYTPTPGTTAAGWAETMGIIVNKGVSFIAGCGDQVDTATSESQYTDLFAPVGLRSLPFAPVVGNHDTNIIFKSHYNLPNDQNLASTDTAVMGNYYYLYNNILFVGLNTGGTPGSTTLAATWITRFEDTIKAAKAAHAGKYDWLIVQHHKSTASVATHISDADIMRYVEAGFETIMTEQNVDFVLAGHDHVYARSHPLSGRGNGLVSVPDSSTTTTGVGGSNVTAIPGKPIYLTFTTGSGLKYYQVVTDKTDPWSSGIASNTAYPYLGQSTSDDKSTLVGSASYLAGNLPVSNAAWVQPWIPSYTIVEVSNSPTGARTIKFSTYPIATVSGTNSGATESYSFNANTPYDWVLVTK